ncbi:hypothetical protein YPPY66_1710, partial [Yersinia pestis PY-66]|jgi:integrase
MRT